MLILIFYPYVICIYVYLVLNIDKAPLAFLVMWLQWIVEDDILFNYNTVLFGIMHIINKNLPIAICTTAQMAQGIMWGVDHLN